MVPACMAGLSHHNRFISIAREHNIIIGEYIPVFVASFSTFVKTVQITISSELT